jgi:hypothetical protein
MPDLRDIDNPGKILNSATAKERNTENVERGLE